MILCSCGKPMEKVPSWMSAVNVTFVCNNCPNRQTKNIAFISLESESAKAAADPEPAEDAAEEPEAEAADEEA